MTQKNNTDEIYQIELTRWRKIFSANHDKNLEIVNQNFKNIFSLLTASHPEDPDHIGQRTKDVTEGKLAHLVQLGDIVFTRLIEFDLFSDEQISGFLQYLDTYPTNPISEGAIQ